MATLKGHADAEFRSLDSKHQHNFLGTGCEHAAQTSVVTGKTVVIFITCGGFLKMLWKRRLGVQNGDPFTQRLHFAAEQLHHLESYGGLR